MKLAKKLLNIYEAQKPISKKLVKHVKEIEALIKKNKVKFTRDVQLVGSGGDEVPYLYQQVSFIFTTFSLILITSKDTNLVPRKEEDSKLYAFYQFSKRRSADYFVSEHGDFRPSNAPHLPISGSINYDRFAKKLLDVKVMSKVKVTNMDIREYSLKELEGMNSFLVDRFIANKKETIGARHAQDTVKDFHFFVEKSSSGRKYLKAGFYNGDDRDRVLLPEKTTSTKGTEMYIYTRKELLANTSDNLADSDAVKEIFKGGSGKVVMFRRMKPSKAFSQAFKDGDSGRYETNLKYSGGFLLTAAYQAYAGNGENYYDLYFAHKDMKEAIKLLKELK